MFITNKNISESLVRSLQNSFTSQANCEITLMCEGKTIKCHRHVLVLHSTHFNNLFKEQNDFPSAIAVVNMKFIHLKAMVDYMYFGRIKLQEDTDEMKQIIKCAEDLGLSALVTFITEFLKNSAKHKSLNGSANISTSDLNGDDSLMKRKRASDIAPRAANDSFKKPKLNDSSSKTSTPLRDSKPGIKSNLTSDVKVSSDNSETLILDKKRKSDDEEADDEESRRRIKEEEEEKKRKAKEEDERRRKREEDERKRKDEEERKRREEEKQRLEEEKRKKAEEEKRKAEEAERTRIDEEKRKKAQEKKREEEEAARKAEEERSKKETKCDESASTKSCAVCNKQYKDNIDHRKVLEGVTFEKKCIMTGCSKGLPFRRALIDHLLKAHKIDVCDG